MNEEWRIIEEYPDYEVSNLGNVRSIDKDIIDSWGRKYHKQGQLLKIAIQLSKGNYLQAMVSIYQNKKLHRLIVARLVAKAFIPNPDNLPQVNHKNENSLDNRAENLEWCTCQYNINYKTNIERRSRNKCRAIDIFDLDNNYIETLSSGVELSKKYHISRGMISYCCHEKIKSAKGFILKFH